VLGTNVRLNKYIALGAYQSLDIKAPLTVTLIKKNFDTIHVRRLRDAVAD
jgi:stalled ribosome rescue protein Dom34